MNVREFVICQKLGSDKDFVDPIIRKETVYQIPCHDFG